jgi:hypothetical protein
MPIFKEENDKIVVITVYTFFSQKEVKNENILKPSNNLTILPSITFGRLAMTKEKFFFKKVG